MTTNGVSIPDIDKVEIPEDQTAVESTWIELTNHKGDDYGE